ncbi:hypothetical protein EVAR_21075_1 [Eumeta japonica]|uniref:Uncharacterized protein n=1 Tax=Eumeta variegata TaxID=151549 RepID=A0A4C1UZY4_EUMVA|nr:hypothetical protein EVAR_21075_1 [Eumeta japonica]
MISWIERVEIASLSTPKETPKTIKINTISRPTFITISSRPMRNWSLISLMMTNIEVTSKKIPVCWSIENTEKRKKKKEKEDIKDQRNSVKKKPFYQLINHLINRKLGNMFCSIGLEHACDFWLFAMW